MAGRLYSIHRTVTLTAAAAATFEAVITAPATNAIRLTDLIISSDFAAADDPIVARLVRVTSVSGGTAVTPSKHNTENSIASGATVAMDGVTATEVSGSVVFDQWVKPGFSMKPGVVIAPGESWGLELDPGTEERSVKISMYFEE